MRNFNAVEENVFDKQRLSVEQSNQLLTVQKDILEAIVTGRNYQIALDLLCCASETILPDSVASIMLFNKNKNGLSVRAAPNVPDEAVEMLNQLVPGEYSGSCGSAVFHGKPQYVEDTENDPRWQNLREFAQQFNIKACWSMPIIDRSNCVIGSFALSSTKKRVPNHFQEILLYTASYLASLIFIREKEDAILEKAAHFDPLTRLPNRMYIERRAEQAISQAKRNHTELSVFFLDLDNFKQINDGFGHAEGDKVLRFVADRMLDCIRKEDTVARLGGDEFVILIEGNVEKEELELIAFKILQTFAEPMTTNKNQYRVTTSIGISRFPENGTTWLSLLKAADRAMYRAKASGKNEFKFH